MRKKIMNLTAVAVMLFLGACSKQNEILTENNSEAESTITLTASMPVDDPTTRVLLTRDEKNIKLTWQTDVLQLAIVQGVNKYRIGHKLKASEIDDNRVEFTITLPAGINTTLPFDIYGLYGLHDEAIGGNPEVFSLSNDNFTNVILTKTPGSMGTLTAVQNRGDVMIYFEAKSISASNPPARVTFKHIGSLFSVSFNNTVTPGASAITQARLVGVNADGTPLTNGNWAYNNGEGGQIFDLLTGQFQNTNTAGNYISFATAGSTWTAGQTTTLWGWYPPIPNEAWPALRLQMTDSDGNAILSSINFKPAKAAAPVAGKTYHFYARWDGNNLAFTDDTFLVPSPAIPVTN